MYQYFHASAALLPDGWARAVTFAVDTAGTLREIRCGGDCPAGAVALPGPVLPGMVNVHSHAFQRLMAGLAERPGGGAEDSFWTWRERMYALVSALTPEQVHAIARSLYVHMLEAGYTAVAEFHYLHRDADGRPYADPAEMSLQVLAAAASAGLPITLLPTLYCHGGFGGQPLAPAQRRFSMDDEQALALLDRLDRQTREHQRVGVAFHSLRAVDGARMRRVLDALPGDRPIHIHAAEQQREVDDCLAHHARRPVAHLLDTVGLDARWCLVHATHMSPDETARMARSGACAGLCPSTEASLGDGLFPAPEFVAAGGRFAIGSDSHVSVSPLEELRWLEYGQRLRTQRRNRLHDGGEVGTFLYGEAATGGARAAAQPTGALEVGRRADFVVLDGGQPMLAGCAPEQIASRWLFAGEQAWVGEVWVAGRRAVAGGRHPLHDETSRELAAVARELLA